MPPSPRPVEALIDEAFAHHREGQLDRAEPLYRSALEAEADNFQALQLLGTLALNSQRIPEAIALLERARIVLEHRSDEATRHASLYNNLGIALRVSGRCAEAAEQFRHGLALDPNLTELHVSLAGALLELGEGAGAAQSYEAALALNPRLPNCLCDIGTLHAQSGKLEEAIVFYRRAVAIDPLHWAARVNLAQMLRRTEHYDEAIALLAGLLKEAPDNLFIHSQLGMVYTAQQNFVSALAHFGCVLAQKPDDAEALQYLANIQQSLGDTTAAAENFHRSHALRPLITIAATQSPPAFSALLLFAPGAGNTPLDCLADQAEYENNIVNFMPDAHYDIEMLRARADVVINLIADADMSAAILAPAAELVDRIGKPVVNHPRKILQTDRATIAEKLAATPGCVVPKTRRYPGAALGMAGFLAAEDFSFPFLARRAGTHGGIDFEKIDSTAKLDAFVVRNPAADYYLTDYVDFRSADGYFRKYRYIYIGDDILAYHLAIDDKWKIHHVTTDMVNQPWQQAEEKAFLENPDAVFGPDQRAALRAVQKRIDLDYFGIDCALDRQGRVVVFEVNACMLVHQHNAGFPYKNEPVRRIKTTFDVMLKCVAGK